jgi:polyisoprenoid-binding protein YceI
MAAVSSSESTTAQNKSVWHIDPDHSGIEFAIRHLMITTIKGQFSQYGARIDWDEDDLTQSSVVAHIDPNSMTTGNEYRDQHVRGPLFMHVENYPEMTFKSTRIERISDDEYKIYGDLTFLGVTKEVKLDTTYGGRDVHPVTGNTVTGFEARTTINRKDFGMNFHQVLDSGRLALGDDVKIEINAQLIKEDEAKTGSQAHSEPKE